MKELEEFLQNMMGVKKENDFMYHFYYNGIPCFGVVAILPYIIQLSIRPCKYTDKIGDVSGEAIYKSFKRDSEPKILLSPKDISIGFANWIEDTSHYFGSMDKGYWLKHKDRTDTKYTTEQLFNEYLNTLK